MHSPVGHASEDTGGEDHLRFERLVAHLAARFVNILADEADDAVVDSQRQIVLALDVDRSSLFQVTEGGDLMYTHSWTRPEHEIPIPPVSAGVSFPWFLSRLRAGETVAVHDVDDVPTATDRETMTRFGFRATVAVPLLESGRLLGTLTFASLRAPQIWPAPVHQCRTASTPVNQACYMWWDLFRPGDARTTRLAMTCIKRSSKY